MGRPKKSLKQSKGNLTVLQQEEKKHAEELTSGLTKLDPVPPEWLDDTAKKEYLRIYPLLEELPTTASLDLALVSAYCQSFSDYINATKRMNSGEPIIETDRGTKLNQNHAIKRDALSQLNSIAPKIGLSVDARLKIFTPKQDKVTDDPFEVMLNAKNK
ncbi:phage terminase small subunit P27 family [Staphylococcus haemolyticus]|uniref:phage terminase small subunit P27 family n=1 Tax=Staphylococcus haemolyticus TaxID=1283 RepID=UPI000D1F0C15|nr:phage terminase small subunit P27 family [Staphylococcus haemolyticus]PTK63361.1 phage terminase small subunit P27 family [Staphylococcus haemolyticus]